MIASETTFTKASDNEAVAKIRHTANGSLGSVKANDINAKN